MKSYNGLYAAMMEPEEIVLAIKEAAKGKAKRKPVIRAMRDPEAKAAEITRKIAKGWKPPHHEAKPLQEGSHEKLRMIQKPRWDDEQIVHHMLVRQFKPIVLKSVYRYACGSIPGRGTHYALATMKRWRDEYKGKKFYVAELDIKKFYDSVDNGLLKAKLARKIRDKEYLDLLFRVIDGGGPGLPKGFYTSPWFAHYLLTPLDHHIVQQLKPDHYIRYMDNMFLFSRNKKELHAIVREVGRYLGEELHLLLKEDWQVYRFEGYSRRAGKETGRAINCLGFVIHRNRVTMRKSILKRARAKANRIHRRRRYRRIDAASMISYMGYFSHSNTYGYYLHHIKPKVSIQYCKRRISALDKRAAKNHPKRRGKK